jgi:hypothetical protein
MMPWPGDDAERTPVPPELFSAKDEGPFKTCSDCGASLEAPDALHLIGKSWRDGEVIFEFALCMGCGLTLFSQYSEESRRNLEEYFRPLSGSGGGATACVRCGRSGPELEREKNLEGLAMGGMLLDQPILICGPCAEGADAVLSKKTREAFDDFVRRVCPSFPSDAELPAPVFSLP